jgi:hypothetical protein
MPHFPRASLERLSGLLAVAGFAWILGSCGSDSLRGFCAAPISLAVVVTVRDSTSGLAAADGAIGNLVGAGVDDTLEHIDSLTIRGGDQTGTYTVTIDKPGYLTWQATNVHVTHQGECGNVIPVDLNALLQAATP